MMKVMWRCQFCGAEHAPKAWKRAGDVCPSCNLPYDAQLAQDGDDE